MYEPWELALQYEGIPFRHRGRSPRGLDCVGLLILVAFQLGLSVVDKKVYGRDPVKDGLRDYLLVNGCTLVSFPLAVNQIALMQFKDKEHPSHVGIVAPHPLGLSMIHTHGRAGGVVRRRIDDTFEERIVEVFSWPKKP